MTLSAVHQHPDARQPARTGVARRSLARERHRGALLGDGARVRELVRAELLAQRGRARLERGVLDQARRAFRLPRV